MIAIFAGALLRDWRGCSAEIAAAWSGAIFRLTPRPIPARHLVAASAEMFVEHRAEEKRGRIEPQGDLIPRKAFGV
jgi:hypothetical protein